MDNYLEKKKMVRLNSRDSNIIFGTNLSTLNIGLMICGRAKWQEAEATRNDFNIVLTRHDKKFFTSELFKVIQDAIPLSLRWGHRSNEYVETRIWTRIHKTLRFYTQTC